LDTDTGLLAETADETEEVAVVLRIDVVGDAAESIEHALAELLVGGWWEGRRGSPLSANAWALSCGGVGGLVVGGIGTGGIDLSNLGGEVVEVFEGGNRVAAD
jgi:hypothetical protein